jgi:hypothetical protein
MLHKNYVRKDKAPIRACPHCNTIMNKDIILLSEKTAQVVYECPNNCALSFNESYIWVENTPDLIYYEEVKEDV